MTTSEYFTYSERALSGRMQPSSGYFKRLIVALSGMDASLTMVEKCLLLTVLLMLGVCAVDAFHGMGVGNEDAIRMAKLQGQQEITAQRHTAQP
jgi:hypothetical protein